MFYYGTEKDTWSQNAKGNITGNKKRTAAISELDDFAGLLDSHTPWQQFEEPTPSTNMLPDEQPTTAPQQIKRVKNEPVSGTSSASTRQPCHSLPSPSPSPKRGDIQMDREEYEKKMTSLIASVHKVSGEWNRKGREFTMAVAKSSCNHLTSESAVEAALQSTVKQGEEMVKQMDKVETDWAKGIDVDYNTQIYIKKKVDDVYDLIKSGNKLKLPLRGILYCPYVVPLDNCCATHQHPSSFT